MFMHDFFHLKFYSCMGMNQLFMMFSLYIFLGDLFYIYIFFCILTVFEFLFF